MRKINIISGMVFAGFLVNCGGGAVGNLVKMRDEGKSLGIVCNITMTEPGLIEENAGLGDGQMIQVRNGAWDENEKAEYLKWANSKCSEIVSFTQKSISFKNAEIVDIKKVPTAYREFFGRQLPYQDYTQTRFDYIWKIDIAADKTARQRTDSGHVIGGSNIQTKVQMRTLAEDWSKKDASKVGIAFQDYDFAFCSNGFGVQTPKYPKEVADNEYKTLTGDILGQCEVGVKSKISKMQKDVDELNSKKKS